MKRAQVPGMFASVRKDRHGTGAASVQSSRQKPIRIQGLEANTTTIASSSSGTSGLEFQQLYFHQLC